MSVAKLVGLCFKSIQCLVAVVRVIFAAFPGVIVALFVRRVETIRDHQCIKEFATCDEVFVSHNYT